MVFAVFSVLYLKESFKLNYLLSFLCILGAIFFAFKKFQQQVQRKQMNKSHTFSTILYC
ncbi:DMT family protein [Ruminiclostridium hungatei]|uniref:DMT family protein n=1 Tax=Ruminiclostridium hungatei TaxID=48256 RepID=UPI000E3D50C7|nr:DMT family protein [Ruminiclostridium hungatei]